MPSDRPQTPTAPAGGLEPWIGSLSETLYGARGCSLIGTDGDGRVTLFSRGAESLLGYTAEEVLGRTTAGLFEEPPRVTAAPGAPEEREWVYVRKDGTRVPVLLTRCPVRDDRGAFAGHLNLAFDLSRTTRRDSLTGLPNRFDLGEQLAHCARESRRAAGFRFALLYLDVDRFQTINESLGPPTGDALLTEIATRLGAALRAEDGIAREHPNPAAHLGGDEFVILLRGIGGEADAKRVADRLRNELERPYQVRGYALSISFSIGIVLSGYGSDSPEEMLSDAGSAMGEAKLRGRRRSVFFDVGMRERVRHRRALRNDLHVALEKAQMSLAYQPLMNLETGAIAGCEVLLRWNHPTLGGISPAEFVPIAEDSGVILELGDWVLREAIREYGGWRKRLGALTPETLSVNLSRAQLILDDLAPKIEAMLRAADVEPWRLHLEITETAVMRDLEQALRTLHALRAIGVKLDLDDFGTGYSSLANLHQLPLDVIKIDRSFVRRLEADRRSAALIEAVISLARILDLKVVAEGIETPRELEQLQAIGCHLGQGYLFAQPLPPQEFAAFLSAGDRLEVLAMQSVATLGS